MTLEEKIETIISDIQYAVFYAEEDSRILKNQRRYFADRILFELKEIIKSK